MWLWMYVLVACGGLGWAMNSWEIPQGRLEDLISPKLDDRWVLFKKTHNRTYNGQKEELTRRIYWEDAVRFIDLHNEKYNRGESTYYMGETTFADMADDEYLKMFNSGLILPEQGEEDFTELVMGPLLGSIDWREKGKVSPVKNQRDCGSCWAFSAVAAIESLDAIKTGRMGPALSEQQLVDCSRSFGNYGCHGGWMNTAFTYLKNTNGIIKSSCYPYTAKDQTCKYSQYDQAWCLGPKIRSYSNVGRSKRDLDRALSNVGPVSIAMDASQRSFGYYKGGIYHEPACNSDWPTHAMAAVGYACEYYIVKNSWGTDWGEKGYIRIYRGYDMCGITKYASYPNL